ncbi:MAG: response regulator transcription factor [Bacteroidetes bacterium]|nr:response regulator transcription factor [Bacteroidota bacterium]
MIRILIADDHPIVRNGLKQMISDEADMNVVCEASDAGEVFAGIEKNELDVLILDISMPGTGGFEILSRLRNNGSKTPVLMLSALSEDLYASKSLKAGASGFINKESAPEELVKAIRKVFSGGVYVSSHLAEKLAVDLKHDVDKPPYEYLSTREFQIMCMIASGKTVSEIAKELYINVKTVSTYRSRILEKMNFRNNSELTKFCIREGFVK